MDLTVFTDEVHQALQELLAVGTLQPRQILVVGCSTSEISGEKIGTAPNQAIAQAVLAGLYPLVLQKELYLAVQCCEHLNRAVVLEKEACRQYNLAEVRVYPVPEAGGSLASAVMSLLRQPTLVEKVQGHAGLDIGDTFIGMHLKPVVVPLRSSIRRIGSAHLTLAYTRPKLIGGVRARYEKPE